MSLRPGTVLNFPLSKETYKLLHELGSGSYGTVHLAQRVSDHTKVVVKVSKNEVGAHLAMNEAKVMVDLVHPNIVRILDHYNQGADPKSGFPTSVSYIVMEYCDLGCLDSLIKERKQQAVPLADDLIHLIVSQCVYALYYCHVQHFLHRDLKAENILFQSGTEHDLVKLCDFGLSKSVRSTTAFAQTKVGTPHYLAPEVLAAAPYNDRADMWSLGVLLYELLSFSKPFPGKTVKEVFAAIQSDPPKPFSSQVEHRYPAELTTLCMKLLNKNPKQRPSSAELLQCHWVKKALRQSMPELPLEYLKGRESRQVMAWNRLTCHATEKSSKVYKAITPDVKIQIRSGPSLTAEGMGIIHPGDHIEVIGHRKEPTPSGSPSASCLWLQLAVPQGGWCISEYFKEEKPQSSEDVQRLASDRSKIQHVRNGQVVYGQMAKLFEELQEWQIVRPGEFFEELDSPDDTIESISSPTALLSSKSDSTNSPGSPKTQVSDSARRNINWCVFQVLFGQKAEAAKGLRSQLQNLSFEPQLLEKVLAFHREVATEGDDTVWMTGVCQLLRSQGIPFNPYLRALRALCATEDGCK